MRRLGHRFLLLMTIVVVGGVLGMVDYYREDAVFDRILNQKEYHVSLLEEGISVEFEVDPAWIPRGIDEVKVLHLPVGTVHGTTIILEKVGKRNTDFYFSLLAKPELPLQAGEFLYVYTLNPDGGTSTGGGINDWTVYDSSHRALRKPEEVNFGGGMGSENSFSIFISEEYRTIFEQKTYLRYSGLKLYSYRKM